MSRYIRLWGAVVAAMLAVSSCASIKVSDLPQPGNSYTDGYDIQLEFDNVLNLPDQAKVVLDGTTVGVMNDVEVKPDQVLVTARIDRDVAVPSNIHAVLQQATVLGDIYIALERPASDGAGAPPLSPGGTVPLAQTTSPPQLEDTIANMANFVASGSIQRIQNTIIGVNRVTPDQEKLRRLVTQVSADISDLSENIETVDLWLDGVAGTANVMYNRIPSYEYWFSPEGMTNWDHGMTVANYMGNLIPSVGSIYNGGFWLVPLFESLADTTGAIKDAKWAVEDEWPAWRRLFTDTFLPQDKYPAMNITSIVGPDGRELSGNVQDVLRILGAMP